MDITKKSFIFATGIEIENSLTKLAQGNPQNIQAIIANVNNFLQPLTMAAQSGFLTAQMLSGLSNLQGFLSNPTIKDIVVKGLQNIAKFITDPALVNAAKAALPQLANIFNIKPQGKAMKMSSFDRLVKKYGQTNDLRKDWAEQDEFGNPIQHKTLQDFVNEPINETKPVAEPKAPVPFEGFPRDIQTFDRTHQIDKPIDKNIQAALGVDQDGEWGPTTNAAIEYFKFHHNMKNIPNGQLTPELVSAILSSKKAVNLNALIAKYGIGGMSGGVIAPVMQSQFPSIDPKVQVALGVQSDGKLGPETIKALENWKFQHQEFAAIPNGTTTPTMNAAILAKPLNMQNQINQLNKDTTRPGPKTKSRFDKGWHADRYAAVVKKLMTKYS